MLPVDVDLEFFSFVGWPSYHGHATAATRTQMKWNQAACHGGYWGDDPHMGQWSGTVRAVSSSINEVGNVLHATNKRAVCMMRGNGIREGDKELLSPHR